MPEPIGGLEALLDRIQIPPELAHAGLAGVMLLEFVVTAEGRVEDVVVARGLHPDVDAEVVRIIEETIFHPGLALGYPVDVQYQLELHFEENVVQLVPQRLELGIENFQLRFAEQMLRLTGRVRVEGRPLADAIVELEGTDSRASTDEDGVFHLDVPLADLVETPVLIVTHEATMPARIELQIEQRVE
jgi:TonB family protein